MFIDTKVEIVFEAHGLAGFTIDRLCDEMFSSTIIYDYDADRDGTFSRSETKEIEEFAFSNL